MADVTGPELRRERRKAEVTVVDVADRMGVSRQTAHNIEKFAEPDPDEVEAWRAAIALGPSTRQRRAAVSKTTDTRGVA